MSVRVKQTAVQNVVGTGASQGILGDIQRSDGAGGFIGTTDLYYLGGALQFVGVLQIVNPLGNVLQIEPDPLMPAPLTFRLPPLFPAGNNYLVKSSTAGILGYTDPATFGTAAQITALTNALAAAVAAQATVNTTLTNAAAAAQTAGNQGIADAAAAQATGTAAAAAALAAQTDATAGLAAAAAAQSTANGAATAATSAQTAANAAQATANAALPTSALAANLAGLGGLTGNYAISGSLGGSAQLSNGLVVSPWTTAT